MYAHLRLMTVRRLCMHVICRCRWGMRGTCYVHWVECIGYLNVRRCDAHMAYTCTYGMKRHSMWHSWAWHTTYTHTYIRMHIHTYFVRIDPRFMSLALMHLAINNIWILSKVLQRSWLCHCDQSCELTQIYEVWYWNSPWWWSYERFCLPTTTIARAPHFDVHWQYSSQERPMKILSTLPLVRAIVHWCLHAETHPNGEVASAVIIFWVVSGWVCSGLLWGLTSLPVLTILQPTTTTRDYCAAKIQPIKSFIELWMVQVRKELVESKVAPFSYLELLSTTAFLLDRCDAH